MKFFKLILIFILLAGGLTVALLWETIVPPGDKAQQVDSFDMARVDEERANIVDQWERQPDWDKNLHIRQSSRIDQLKNSGLIGENGYLTLRNSIIENSSNKALKNYMKAINAENRSKEKVNDSYKAFVFLRDNEGLKDDPRVKEGLERHRLFTNVSNFVGNPHKISPNFKTEQLDWVSFDSQQNRILNEASSYRGHKYYADIRTWPGFDEGLNSAKLKSVTEAQRKGFYQNLSNQIINHFSSASGQPTEERAANLKTVFTRFANESNETSQLASFRRNYEKSLQSNN